MLTRVLTRYLVKDLFTHSLAVSVIVIVISIARRLGNYLQEATSGQLPIETVVQLVGIRTIIALPSLMPIGLYFGTILVLRRLRAENEMTALEAGGVPPMYVGRVVIAFAVGFAVLDGMLALTVRPHAARKFAEVASVLRLSNLQPGRFYEIGGEDDLILFIGAKAADGTLENVFLQKRESRKLLLTSCEHASEQLTETEGYRFLGLSDGDMYEFNGEPQSDTVTITHYRQMLMRMALAHPAEEWPENAKDTGELMHSAETRDAAEFQWRLAMPVSTVVLGLTAVVLALSPISGSLLLPMALYVAYQQSLGVAKNWVERSLLGPFPGLWLVHALWIGGIFICLWRLPSGPRSTLRRRRL